MAGAAVLNTNVLVLNKFYMAIHVVTVRRAFALLCKHNAEVVAVRDGRYDTYDFDSWRELSAFREEFEPDGDWIRSVNFEVRVPRVIRLLMYDRLPRQRVKFNRRNIYARDANRCQYCGKRHPTSELSLDHVVPRSRGGKSTWTNVVCACLACNVRKGGRLPGEVGLKLIRSPAEPRRSPVIALHLGHQRYRSWKQFLDHAYWSVELK
ncbi:MAG: HNH endonuclease [Planctomycetes bacterium DG_20]|nr:MAG: HNH endonuclease [Planctomycetes bacterium DG_20]